MLLPLLAFAFGSLVVAAAAIKFMPNRAAVIDRRLQELTTPHEDMADAKPRMQSLIGLFKRIGEKSPRSAKELGSLRLRLVQAGYRRDEAITIFFGIRVLCAFLLFAFFSTSIVARPNMTMALAGLGVGYVVPGMVLARMAKRRAHRIRLSLADALDLLVVSVEAGLGLDQALQRVGSELAFAYPELSDELRLINLELRAGKARSEALRNLADRTGVDDLSALVTMLIQTDKFGTSVAQSLRVYSETLRTKRRQRAEEAAAKTGVKMVFPLVFCIFPAIWVVTIGPAAIRFMTVLFPMVNNMKKSVRARSRRRARRGPTSKETRNPMSLIARNIDTGSVIADRVGVAATRETRRVGLLKHSSLEPGEALWIIPSRGVHTWGMRFAIDIIALDDRGVVIDRVVHMKPRRIRLPRPGTAGVLELPAGTLERSGTDVGHRIEFEQTEPAQMGTTPVTSTAHHAESRS